MDRDYTFKLLRCAYNVYDELGPGLLESIYEEALCRELKSKGFSVERQKTVPVYYKGEQLKDNLRIDIIVDGKVILELKSVTEYRKLFEKQLYTYLRITGCELGYVINFNEEKLGNGIHTVCNPYARSAAR